MDDLLKKDYARRVNCQDKTNKHSLKWFSTFDCSTKYLGTSLDTQLLQGPVLTNTFVGVLFRFSKKQIVLMADVEAMFHQVHISSTDCDVLRFLWWLDCKLDNEPQEY